MDSKVKLKRKLIILALILGAGAVGISFNWFKGRFFQNKTLEQLWTAKSVTPEEFTKLYVSLFKEMAPEYTFEIIAPLELQINNPNNDNLSKIYLGNAYKKGQISPTERKEMCAYYIKCFMDSSSIDKENRIIDPNKIVPIIKDQRYIDNLPLDVNSEKPIVFNSLAGDIYITYAVEDQQFIHFIRPSEMRTLNISFEQLQQLAVNNLIKALPKIGVATYEKCSVIEASYHNKASLLLYDNMWKQIEKKNSGRIIAAVPGNDMLIFTTTETIGGVAKLKEIARKGTEIESYLISETLLIRQDSKWEVFKKEDEK